MSSAVRRHHEISHDSLSTYLDEIRAYPLLTRNEEAELARRIRNGDKSALDRLVCANLRFVVSVAKKYQGQGLVESVPVPAMMIFPDEAADRTNSMAFSPSMSFMRMPSPVDPRTK